MQLDKSEIILLRMWIDVLMDVNPEFLDREDFALGVRLYEACGMRPSVAMIEQAKNANNLVTDYLGITSTRDRE